MIKILKDIRNEKTPQWSSSTYHIANIFVSGAINTMLELSNYSAYAQMWDGFATASKRFYNLSDSLFNFIPWPPMINALVNAGRRKFTKRWAGWVGNKLFINYIENIIINWLKNDLPEMFELTFIKQWEKGIEYPIQSIISSRDLIKNHSESGEYFKPIKGPKIHLEDLGITMQDAFKGYYLRVDHRTNPKEKVDPSKIISIGLGRNSEVLQE